MRKKEENENRPEAPMEPPLLSLGFYKQDAPMEHRVSIKSRKAPEEPQFIEKTESRYRSIGNS